MPQCNDMHLALKCDANTEKNVPFPNTSIIYFKGFLLHSKNLLLNTSKSTNKLINNIKN